MTTTTVNPTKSNINNTVFIFLLVAATNNADGYRQQVNTGQPLNNTSTKQR